MIEDGWMFSSCIYNSVLLGLEYGLYALLVRLKMMSRKFTTCLFASMVIHRPCSLKMKIFSVSLGIASVMAKPLFYVISIF